MKKKICYKIQRKKTHQFHKTLPTKLSFDINNLYKKIHYPSVYYFCDILAKIEQILNLFVNKLFGGSPKMSTKYCVTKSEKKNSPFLLSRGGTPRLASPLCKKNKKN